MVVVMIWVVLVRFGVWVSRFEHHAPLVTDSGVHHVPTPRVQMSVTGPELRTL